MRVQRYTDKSIYVQHFYIKNNTEHKKRKYITLIPQHYSLTLFISA